MPTPKDENQLAARILYAATETTLRPGESPQQRAVRAGLARGGAKAMDGKSEDERAAQARRAASARWDGATLDDMATRPKHLDPNQLAKRILDEATGEEPKTSPEPTKNQAAQELGRLGGKKGGIARKQSLSAEERSEIAKKAAAARWSIGNKQ